mgnify:CR=1 FL=1
MIRKLVFALSLLGACFTGLVHALGLGEATVKSSLNQPLAAEIELVSIGELGIDEILPGLATREEFLRAKVDRVYFLSDLRFEVIENKKGNLAVVLTTTKPVREPFLNFLVEVIWPSGRLLREYALLIDPPLYNKEKVALVQTPVVSQGNTVSQPVAETVSGDQLNIAEPAKTSVAAINTTGQRGGTYGATTSKDTLWDIAIKARPNRSVTPQQVMLSIQDLNPKAFINQNINKLKAGQVLRLPALEQIKERSSSQAITEVIAQNEAVRPKRTRSVASATKKVSSTTSESSGSNKDELKLVVASNQANTSNTANSGSSMQAGNGRAESNEEMMLALEKLDKASLENTELNGRVTDLEEQLQTLQRILALKNDQLANIQGQMRANELAELVETVEVAAGTEMGQTDVGKTALGPNESMGPSKAIDEPKAAPTEIAKKVVAPVSSPKISDPVPEKAENIFEVILNNPLYLGLLVIGVIILLAVLWLVSRNNGLKEEEYYAENESEEDDAPSGEVSETDESEPQERNENFDEISDFEAGDETELVDNAFALDDEESSDLDSHQDEREAEDVIAEADVYIAYGRLDQAANILENAISAEPVRTDYRLKLLEVYKDSNDAEAFNRQFSELEAIQDTNAIEEASQIRTELLENELVSLEDKEQELAGSRQLEDELEAQQEHDAALETEEAAIENDAKSFDFDSVDEDETDEVGLDVDFSSDELELDLDVDLELSQDDEPSITEKEELESVAEDQNFASALEESEGDNLLGEELDAALSGDADLLDIDLDDLDDVDLSGELDQETEIDLSDDFSAELESTELDLSTESDLTLGSELSLAEEALPEAADEEEPEAADEEEPVAADEEEPVAVSDVVTDEALDEVVSDEILDEAVEAFSGADELADELGDSDDFDFLDGTDEASTKLDLARAYIDMGDVDGAKDILEEVAKEGSEEQQAEANDLLGSLDA